MRIHDRGDRLTFVHEQRVIATYVFSPTDPQRESPRPYALLSSLTGVAVTAHRPGDHVWHKGLSLALPSVGRHNFWGGPTYEPGRGYVQRENNGSQLHIAFSRVAAQTDAGSVSESLSWRSATNERVLVEQRTLRARVLDESTWSLSWTSDLTNVSGSPLTFGSPSTAGRSGAGYAGIFFRGAAEFRGGVIHSAAGQTLETVRGEPQRWLALSAADAGAGVLMIDDSPTESPWFVRTAEYPGLNPAPFFFSEYALPSGESLRMSATVVVGGADIHRRARELLSRTDVTIGVAGGVPVDERGTSS